MKPHSFFKYLSFVFLVLVLSACMDSANEADNDKVDGDGNVDIEFSGSVQKGPYETGTVITIHELDKNLSQTGNSYTTSVVNSFGEYSFSGKLRSNFIEVFANGYYFDEVSNSTSSSQLQLSSVVDVSQADKVNINILSSLVKPRVVALMNGKGVEFTEAKEQAENEVLRAFNIYDNINSFEELDLSQSDKEGRVLLAISSVLMQAAIIRDSDRGSIPGELSILQTSLSNELAEGEIKSDWLKELIVEASVKLDVNEVVSNLIDRYGFSVSNFGEYIGGVVPNAFNFEDVANEENRISSSVGPIEVFGLPDDSYSIISVPDDVFLFVNGQEVERGYYALKNSDVVSLEYETSSYNESKDIDINIGSEVISFKTSAKKTPELNICTVMGTDGCDAYVETGFVDAESRLIYMLHGSDGVYVYRAASDWESFELLSSYSHTTSAADIWVNDRILYFIDIHYGLHALDASDPESLVFLGKAAGRSGVSINGRVIAFDSTRSNVYSGFGWYSGTAGSGEGYHVYSLDINGKPEHSKEVKTGIEPHFVTVNESSSHAVAAGTKGISVIDLSDSTVQFSITDDIRAISAHFINDNIFASLGVDGVNIFKFSDAALEKTGSYVDSFSFSHDDSARLVQSNSGGDRLFVAVDKSLFVFELDVHGGIELQREINMGEDINAIQYTVDGLYIFKTEGLILLPSH